jgi:hypothetical protein
MKKHNKLILIIGAFSLFFLTSSLLFLPTLADNSLTLRPSTNWDTISWSSPTQITDNNLLDKSPDIAVKGDIIHMAYVGDDTSNNEARYKNSTNFANDDNTIIDNDITDNFDPSICISSNDNIFIIWKEANQVFLSKSEDDGETFSSPPERFSSTVDYVDAEIDESDNIHIAWINDTGVYYRFYNTSSNAYDSPINIPDTDGDETSVCITAWNTWNNPAAIINANVHIAFVDEDNYVSDPHSKADTEIRYISSNGNLNNLSSKTPVWVTVNGLDDSDPSIAINEKESGVAHIVWIHDGTNTRVHYVTSANFLAQKILSTESRDSISPDITVDSNSIGHVVWCQNDSSTQYYKIMYSYVEELVPSTAQEISEGLTSDNNYQPTITADSSDDIHVAWQYTIGTDAELFYAKGTTTQTSDGTYSSLRLVVLSQLMAGTDEGAIPGYPLFIVLLSILGIAGLLLKKNNFLG